MRYFNLIFIAFILCACGKHDKNCMSMEEATLRCKAELVSEYFPGRVPDLLNQTCERSYSVEACY